MISSKISISSKKITKSSHFSHTSVAFLTKNGVLYNVIKREITQEIPKTLKRVGKMKTQSSYETRDFIKNLESACKI